MAQQQAIEELRKLVLTEKDLNPCTEDGFLIKFLHTCNFDLDQSFKRVKAYYKLMFDHPEVYEDLIPSSPDMRAVCNQNILSILPETDIFNRKIIAHTFDNWEPSLSSLSNLFSALVMCIEGLVEAEKEVQTTGITIIYDMDGIAFKHVKELSPSNMKKLITYVDNAMPVYCHAFHIINENPVFKMIYTLLLPLLSKSLTDRIFFHGKNLKAFHEVINPNILPQEFGGSKPPLTTKATFEKLKKHEDFLLKINQYGYKGKK